MRSDNDKKFIRQQLHGILRFQDDHEKLEFEAEMLHLDIIHQIRLLMSEYGVKRDGLAEKLNISNDEVAQLFSGGKLADLRLLARLQRIFKIRFGVISKKPPEYDEEYKKYADHNGFRGVCEAL